MEPLKSPAIPIRRKERAASLPFNDEDVGDDVRRDVSATVTAVNALVSLPVTRNNR